MTVDILQNFLRLQLFDVGGDDARLEKIREATATLQTAATEQDNKFLEFFLTATHVQATIEHPTIKEAATALEEKWNSYAGCFPSPPVALFRAMLLQAAFAAAETAPDKRAFVTLILRNVVTRIPFGKERGIWTEVLQRCEAAFESEATEAWSDSPAPKKFSPKIDRNKLEAAILGASGHHGADNNPGTNPNTHWPSENGPWGTEFSKRMTVAVGDAIDSVVSQALATHEKRLAQVGGVALRNRLLWWKEAGYSPKLKQGYDQLAPTIAALLCAIDLSDQIAAYPPTSVEYFLRSVVGSYAPESSKRFADWLHDFSGTPKKGTVVSGLGDILPEGLLISAIAASAAGDKAQMPAAFSGDEAVPLAEVALIVFRELQALSKLELEQP